MTAYKPVVFNPGTPIDVNQLNQLQLNTSDVYQTTSVVNSTSDTVSGLQEVVKTIPIVEVGEVELTVPGQSCKVEPVLLTNQGFTEAPRIVASVVSNIKKDSALTVRATALSATQATIEVCTNNKDSQSVKINYIAIQMKKIQ